MGLFRKHPSLESIAEKEMSAEMIEALKRISDKKIEVHYRVDNKVKIEVGKIIGEPNKHSFYFGSNEDYHLINFNAVSENSDYVTLILEGENILYKK